MHPVVPYYEPLVFKPIYQQRVWGGRALASRYDRVLPEAEAPYGESWEISDRPGDESRVVAGPEEVVGRTLGELWRSDDVGLRESIFGLGAPGEGPFPLLCKILDARERLSLQVHPPAAVARELGGEPKTEMWFVAEAEPGAELIVGLKAGVTREAFAAALAAGSAEDLVHHLPVKAGDFLFIPSGRLHAIGAGLQIFEIQQNSDTTYRVFDWNRVGLDGQPRQLHLEESLRCIDFDDVTPGVGVPNGTLLVEAPEFRVERHRNSVVSLPEKQACLVTVIEGPAHLGEFGRPFSEGDFFLVPAHWHEAKRLIGDGGEIEVLLTTWP